MVRIHPPDPREFIKTGDAWKSMYTKAKSAASWVSAIFRLFPTGAAWTRRKDSLMYALIDALSKEFRRLGLKMDQLITERDPRTTVDLLLEWEDFLGLPDECLPAVASTVRDRQAAIVAKLTDIGGQNKQFFIQKAAELGYEITIEEYEMAGAGNFLTGGRIYDHRWRFLWYVKGLTLNVFYFRCARNSCGDPLRVYSGAEELICLFLKLKPAHTHVEFETT